MSSAPSKIEVVAAWHVALMAVLATWTFGGSSGNARLALSIFGSLALVVTAAAIRQRLFFTRSSIRSLHFLWPLLGYNILVLLSALQPNLKTVIVEGATAFVRRTDVGIWPSSARPALALSELWLFNALYLPAFNLLLTVRQRKTLRVLLTTLVLNAIVLAVLGTLQKLSGSVGPFFGTIEAPNPTFFATFLYHNHWGPFLLLSLAACIGLVFFESTRPEYRDFWHSPALTGAVAAVALTLTAPLSSSRSCTVMVILLAGAGTAQALRKAIRHSRERGRSAARAIVAAFAVVSVATLAIFYIADEVIRGRLNTTQEQITQIRETGSSVGRAQLYADTSRMAGDRFWFGWGLGSYETVFTVYNRQSSPADGLPVHYAEAHSDWLQSIAETGVVGTGLLMLLLATPLFLLRRATRIADVPRYLIAACILVLLYAAFEFPFANPAVVLSFWINLFAALRWTQIDSTSPARTSSRECFQLSS